MHVKVRMSCMCSVEGGNDYITRARGIMKRRCEMRGVCGWKCGHGANSANGGWKEESQKKKEKK